MPISGCHDLPLATFNLPSRVFRHGCRRAECLERRWGGFFHTLSRGQDLPPATALRTNGNNTQNHRHSGISAARRRLSLELRLHGERHCPSQLSKNKIPRRRAGRTWATRSEFPQILVIEPRVKRVAVPGDGFRRFPNALKLAFPATLFPAVFCGIAVRLVLAHILPQNGLGRRPRRARAGQATHLRRQVSVNSNFF